MKNTSLANDARACTGQALGEKIPEDPADVNAPQNLCRTTPRFDAMTSPANRAILFARRVAIALTLRRTLCDLDVIGSFLSQA